jgi:galactokinase
VPQLDALVDRLAATPGVYGARLTGAGFGGCAVAFADPEVDLSPFGGWRVRPSRGASIRSGGA